MGGIDEESRTIEPWWDGSDHEAPLARYEAG